MEVLTNAEMQRADQLSIAAGTPGFKLMLSAGQAVAEAANALVDAGAILIVAGPGNNGGDGFVAAAELAAQGREVSVILMCERDQLQGDAASAARGWKHPVLPFNPQAIGKPALIIDALFGAGLSRPVEGEARAMIEAINANGAPVLAVDLPSGINGTSAAVLGAAVNATETVTFFPRSRRICCCRGACIAGTCALPISASTRRCSTRSRRRFSRTIRISGVRHFRCHASMAINTREAMCSRSPAMPPRPVLHGLRHAGRCAQARAS